MFYEEVLMLLEYPGALKEKHHLLLLIKLHRLI
jgi:hypothetical protein